MVPTPIETGKKIIAGYVKKLPNSPGVYRMLDETGTVLYVGKAKALKKRVVSYTNIDGLPLRLKRLVAQTVTMEFVQTHTEVEALLLESNLIKKFQPPFNVLLRDDKSFPYIHVTGHHDFPQIRKHRGAKKAKGEYFGPYTYTSLVNRTITAMQKAFLVRNCSDSYFATRKRPCLQYHIKRCTAPCVGKVSQEDYAQQVADMKSFLRGQTTKIQSRLAAMMEKASQAMEYEVAAQFRDRIKALSYIQSNQTVNVPDLKEADVIALHREGGASCIQVFFFRMGQNLGNQPYFPRHTSEEPEDKILGAFLAQFYINHAAPAKIYVEAAPDDHQILVQALSKKMQKKVEIIIPQRGEKKRLMAQVKLNAQEALKLKLSEKASQQKLLKGVQEVFSLEETPQRIEVYDNSHISGTNMTGAMIVADNEGFCKNAYRKFNIKTAGKSDDFAMMREVLTRRFARALKEDQGPGSENWPDLVLIDGGAGQLSVSREVLEELGVLDDIDLVAISKGPDRNAGREQFHISGRKPFQLPENDPVLFYLQRLRDEAHRFAIGAHRSRRQKDIKKSPLDMIDGVGAARKKALLMHFGSAKAVARAGVLDLQTVEGISKSMAEKIYNFFHDKG